VRAVRVVVTGGSAPVGPYDLVEGANVVGRGKECAITLPSRTVSRRHATITVSGSLVVIRDEGSGNGVLDAAGARHEQLILTPGAEVRIGHYTLRLEPVPQLADESPEPVGDVPLALDEEQPRVQPATPPGRPPDEARVRANQQHLSTDAPRLPTMPESTASAQTLTSSGSPSPNWTARARDGLLPLLALTAAGPCAMAWAYDFGSRWVTNLGESAGDARLAVGAVFSAGAVTSLLLARRAFAWRRGIVEGLEGAHELALEGASAAEVLDRAQEGSEADRADFRGRASEFANVQVLLGMLLTATWLASHAPQFESAGAALTSSGTSAMAGIVAGLLQLGPKAFVSTAAAVASALIIMMLGIAQFGVLSSLLPRRPELLEAWRAGAAVYNTREIAAQRGRTEELVARAVSVSQVQEMQAAFVTSMNAMAELLNGASQSLENFRHTAELIEAANERLSEVTRSLQTAQVNVESVAGGLAALTKQVESYGDKLLLGTSEFTGQLIKETSERIPAVVSVATMETIKQLRENVLPGFADDLHTGMERSATAIQRQYSEAFSDNLRTAQANLERVSELSGQLEDRTSRLAGELMRTSDAWSKAANELVTTMGSVGDAFASAAGQGEGAARSTDAARAALERAATSAAAAARDLGGLVQSANQELRAIRRDAELLGQIKEAVRPNGGVRGRA
jgi:ABC-type transporter Mla subunit MlaD